MAEVLTGELSFDKGKWKIVFFDEKKRKDSILFCQKGTFSAGFEPKAAEETAVQFERDATPERKAIKVRPKGTEWQEPVHAREGNSVGGAMANQNQTAPGEFHNPYNFVPAPPRKRVEDFTGLVEEQKTLVELLCDAPPTGHDRYAATLYSGRLGVKMKAETPLLLPDTARMHYTNSGSIKDHKSYPVRVNEVGDPIINPTAIKGMLRAAYEAITNSRFSIFHKHDARLAFRSEARSSQGIEPVRIHNKREIHFYSAAWLGKYKHRSKAWKGLDKHGEKVWVKVISKHHPHKHFQYFEVLDLEDITKPKPSSDYSEGYVCITNENIKNKHDERVFFKGSTTRAPQVLNDAELEELKDAWKTLIENYHEEHKHELNTPPASLGIKKWSRQIHKAPGEEILKDGTLCYGRISGGVVKELLPVMISRRLYEKSPLALLPDELNLRPAENIDRLSPADRVFGWVGQRVTKNGAYRGQLRIGTARCLGIQASEEGGSTKYSHDTVEYFGEGNSPNEWLPLQILGQPKPQQGRFYVGEDDFGRAQAKDLSAEDAGYMEKTNYRGRLGLGDETRKGLRGRKVYPHQANLPDDYWSDATNPNLETSKKDQGFYKEYRRRRDDDGREQRDSQNRSIQGWVKKGVVFAFDIHFINLSKVELGALILLLSLNDGLEDAKYFHRFGGGKPLGFGSVSLDLASSQISSGGDLKEFYQSLDSTRRESASAADAKSAFESACLSAGYQRILAAFLRASQGFADNLPTHYPRARHPGQNGPVPPHVDGLAYEWFVENAKAPNQGNPETRLVLSDLVNDKGESDQGLPLLNKT